MLSCYTQLLATRFGHQYSAMQLNVAGRCLRPDPGKWWSLHPWRCSKNM